MPSYQNSNQLALELLKRMGDRDREQMRYAAEDTARTHAAAGQAWGKAISSLPDTYRNAKKYQYDIEESQGRINQGRAKAAVEAEENAYLDTPDKDGISPRQKMRTAELEQTELNNKLKTAQIQGAEAEAYAKRHPEKKPQSMADVKAKVDVASNLFIGAKTAEEKAAARANAKEMGLSSAEIASAEGAATQAQQSSSGEKINDAAKKSGVYANKMRSSNQVIAQLEEAGYEPGSKGRALRGAVPGLKDFTMSPEDRQYDAAATQWVMGLLRDESGATATPSEIKTAMETYFPRAGDDSNTIALKAQMRQEVEENVYAKSGGFAKPDDVEAYALPAKKPKAGEAMAAPSNLPKSVVQNGVTYTLNPKTGKYE